MPNDQYVTPCLLNPGSGEVMSRANNIDATLSHSTQRGIRNADNFDKALDTIIVQGAQFISATLGLSMLDNAIATDSSENENQKNQQVSDTAQGSEQVSIAAMANNVANLALAFGPILASAAGGASQLTILGLASALPAAIAAAQEAATAAASPSRSKSNSAS